MILAIILLILILLILSLIILFSFYIFLPSLNADKIGSDTILSDEEKDFALKEKPEPELSGNKAVVLCSCGKNFLNDRSIFNKSLTCFMAKNTHGSGTDCKYACIGLGDCLKVCEQNAIIIKNNTAVISDICCGCGRCVGACPQNIITLVPKKVQSVITCSNNDPYSFTTCSDKQVEQKIEVNAKKDFKIWAYCYRMVDTVNKFFK